MGDWLSVMTDGWFQQDGVAPDIYEISANGIWIEYSAMEEVVAAEGLAMDLALIYYLYRRRR